MNQFEANSDQKYSSKLFEILPVGVVFQQAGGSITAANPAAQAILGLSLDQLQGRTSFDPRWRAIREDGADFPGEQHPAMQALRTGQEVHDVLMGVHNPQRDAITWIRINAYPIFAGGAAQPAEVMTTFEDITRQHEAALAGQRTRDLLATVLDNITEAFYSLDRNDCFTYVSQKAKELWHKGDAELIGKLIWDIFPDGQKTEAYARIRQVQCERVPARFDTFSNFLNQWVETIVYPNTDGLSVFFMDISERKRAELELRRSEENFRRLFDQSPLPLVISSKSNGKIVLINQAYTSVLGYTQQEAVGLNASQMNVYTRPEERQQLLEKLARQGRLANQEIAGRIRSGEVRQFMSNVEPVEFDGQACFLTTMLDITDLRRAEQELRDAAEFNRKLFHLGPVARSIVSADRKIVLVNEAMRVFAADPQSLIGQDAKELHSNFQQDQWPQVHEDFVAHNYTVRGYEMQMQTAAGAPEWFSVNSDVFEEQGQRFFLNEFINIDPIKKAQLALEELNQSLERRVEERTSALSLANAELQHANRAKDEFLSTMSHELRTPLSAILSLGESLNEGTYGQLAPDQVHAVSRIYESGQHLLELINDILDVSKAESGRLELSKEPVNVKEVVDAAIRLVTPQAMKKRLRISTSLDSNLGTLAADTRRIKQMLVNLLSNAVKFTPEKGRIGIEVTREQGGETISFSVWDTGIGIPPEKIGSLFQPFVQIDSALSREYTGTGLGLALVRRLAELHGGSVGVESQAGAGSRFWFTLPVPQAAESEPLSSPVELPAQTGSLPQRALVIEDSLSAAEHIQRYLADLNTEVIHISNGMDAQRAAEEHQPDIILLDILLPDITGWEVLTKLKNSPKTQHIPVIVVSVVDERAYGLQLGAEEYLVKPFTRPQLLSAFNKVTAVHALLKRVLLVAPQPGAALPAVPQPVQPGGQGRLILYAEDNPINYVTYRDFLATRGYRMLNAANGYEAIERAREFKPDLILMDIQMPALDGLEATRRLRALPEFANLPIIALTALAMPGDKGRCLAAGANSYFAKPVGLKQLLDEIERQLALK